MPTSILEKSYTNILGVTTPFYQNNAGDRTEVQYKVLEQILCVSNADTYLIFNLLENTITWTGGNYYREGFRPNETYRIRVYDANGNFIAGRTDDCLCVQITGQNYNVIKFDDINPVAKPNTTNGEYCTIFPATDYRNEEVVITINHVQTGTTGNEYSLIDGESTTFRFNLKDVAGFPNLIPDGTTINAEIIGKQSGQFVEYCTLTFKSETPQSLGFFNIGYIYLINYQLVNSGIYDITPFAQNKCLKIFNQIQYARTFAEPFHRGSFYVTDDANTGWFDEPFNIGTLYAEILQGMNSVAFDNTTTATVKINHDPLIADFGIGCSYVPKDETYYKHQLESQLELGMTIGSTPFYSTPVLSPVNPDGAEYLVEILNFTSTGTQSTFDIQITPNPFFTDFMTLREEGDREFYVWIFCSNGITSKNLLVFKDELESNPAVGGFLSLTDGFFYDHGENTNTPPSSTLATSGYEANIEDDLGFYGSFLLENDEIYESLTARLEAFNTTTSEKFTLQNCFFNFASVPFVGGKHQLLNISTNLINTLPTTSLKRNATLNLVPPDDTATQYSVGVFFPFLYRWETWLEQSNANNDFYPNNQTKNYYPFGTQGDWTLRIFLNLVKNNLGYQYEQEVKINNYDSEPDITQNIDLLQIGTGAIINSIILGDTIMVRATHTRNDGLSFDPNKTWAMITAEPKNSSPRYIISTAVPVDTNSNNPLSNINGEALMPIIYGTNTATITCLFNATLLNCENGVKFTTKIKTKCGILIPTVLGKTKTTGEFKESTSGNIKEIKI